MSKEESRGRKEKDAYFETSLILRKLIIENGELDVTSLTSLINSKFRNSKFSPFQVRDKLSNIFDDIISEFNESIYVQQLERERLVKRTLFLKSAFQSLNLQQGIAQWKIVSIAAIGSQLSLTIATSLFAIIVLLRLLVWVMPNLSSLRELNISQLVLFGYVLVFAGSLGLLLSFLAKRRRISKDLDKVLENVTIKSILEISPTVKLERQVPIQINGQHSAIELVIGFNEKKVPVIAKHSVTRKDIKSLSIIMKAIDASRSLFVTSSLASKEIRNLAKERQVLLLDGITSQIDISNGLNLISFFS